MRQFIFSLLIAGLSTGLHAQDGLAYRASLPTLGDGVQLSRYSTQPAQPAREIAEPLDAIVRINYPRGTVDTVGDAMRHTLIRTGYQLVDANTLAPQARSFLTLPLPESHRALGPYSVDTILQTLLGSAWQLRHDDVTRTVAFGLANREPLRPSIADLPSHESAQP